ncbi:MAG: hypothetical protein ACXWLJ_05930 [Rhizomicrobium sp.]
MTDTATTSEAPSGYFVARQNLLTPPLNAKKLTLREVRHAGWALAGNPNDLSIYGMRPLLWYPLGIRILGRTAVELTRDLHAFFVATQVAKTLAQKGFRISDVIDPFAGSGNLLFHMLRATKARRGIGFDLGDVSDLTQRNFARLRWTGRLGLTDVALHKQDWSHSADHLQGRPTVVLISPPWGQALTPEGLDLRRTAPPVLTVLEKLRASTRGTPTFAVVQTFPRMAEESVTEITRRYEALPTVRSDNPAINGSIDYLLLRLDRQPSAD